MRFICRHIGSYDIWAGLPTVKHSEDDIRLSSLHVIPSQPCYPVPLCHPVSILSSPPNLVIPSVAEGSIAAGLMRGRARIPPLRFAPVGMTGWGDIHIFLPSCHTVSALVPVSILSSRLNLGILSQSCHPLPTLSSRLNLVIPSQSCHPERSREIYRSWFHAGKCEDSSTSLRSE